MVLKPFHDVMGTLIHSNATLEQVIRLFTCLMDKMGLLNENKEPLHVGVAHFVTKLQGNVKDWLNDSVRKSPELMLSTLCDPRIKGKLALKQPPPTGKKK